MNPWPCLVQGAGIRGSGGRNNKVQGAGTRGSGGVPIKYRGQEQGGRGDGNRKVQGAGTRGSGDESNDGGRGSWVQIELVNVY